MVETLGTAADWGLALHCCSTVDNTVGNNRSTLIAVIVHLFHLLASPSPRLGPPRSELELEFGHSKPVVAVGNTEPLAGCISRNRLQLVVGHSIAGSRRHSQRQSTGRLLELVHLEKSADSVNRPEQHLQKLPDLLN